MKVAVDFGTEYTKVAYLDGENQIRLFSLGSKGDQAYIPSAVAYYSAPSGGDGVAIGKFAHDKVADLRAVTLYEGFKLLLPVVSPDDWQKYGWQPLHSPQEVTRDFFRLLLIEGEYSFTRQKGPIDHLIVTVPEVWQRSGNNLGAETLLRILKEELQLPVDGLLSEPICAAAHYFHRYKEVDRRKGPLTLLINDVGGGTFDVALCRLEGPDYKIIKVLDFDGNGHEGHGLAGVCFDRRATAAAYMAKNGGMLLADDSPVLSKLRREYERAKIASHDWLTRMVVSGDFDSAFEDVPILWLDHEEYTVTVGQVKEAFAPVGQGIASVLQRLKSRAVGAGNKIDRIAIVGGFGQFALVRRAILAALDVTNPEQDVRYSQILDAEEQVNAVVRGAAHILRGDFTTKESYPHSLALRLFATVGCQIREVQVMLCESDQVEAGSINPAYARLPNGKIAVVTSHIDGLTRLPLECRLKGSEEWLQIELPEAQLPLPGKYRVGFVVDRSNLGTLIFESVEGGGSYRYRLGDVKFALTAGEKP